MFTSTSRGGKKGDTQGFRWQEVAARRVEDGVLGAVARNVAIAIREVHAAAAPAELTHGQNGLGDVAGQH
eukprot:10758779-Alexandrium_andersonii.AAC.1